MREKIVAVLFMLIILGIPTITICKNQFGPKEEPPVVSEDAFFDNTMVQDDLTSDESLSADQIAEINREEQLKMQEALQESTGDLAETIPENTTPPETENSETDTNQTVNDTPKNSLGALLDSLKDSVNSFTDNLALIEEAAKINSNITSALADDAYIESAQVLAGKGGWLFYKRADDGTSLPDYQGTSTFSDETMEKIKNQLIAQRDAFAEQGIRYVVMIVPNKEIIYSEYMPSTVYRSSEITRCDKLYDYLLSNTDLEIVYPKLDLFAAKTACQVYYKYDTHWNRVGAFIGVQSVLNQLYGTRQDISDVEIITENTNTSGDLAALVNMVEKYSDDSFYSVKPESYDANQKVDDKILVIGDSFSTLMMDDLKYYFEEAKQVGVWTFKMDMLETYQPDVVLWECVERYADRLSWIDFLKEK